MKNLLAILISAAAAGGAIRAIADEATHVLTEQTRAYDAGAPTFVRAGVESLLKRVQGNFSPVSTDTTYTITLLAPKGKLIRCVMPTEYTNFVGFSATASSTFGEEDTVDTSATATFIRPGGNVPDLTDDQAILSTDPPGYDVSVAGTLVPGQSFSFKGVRIVVTVPASYNFDIDEDAKGAVDAHAQTIDANPVPDPGQFMAIVPDPAVTALNARTRSLDRKLRVAKKKGKKKLVRRFQKSIRIARAQVAALG